MCSSPGEDCIGESPGKCALVARVPDVEGRPSEYEWIILTSRATGKKVPAQFEAGCRSPQRNNHDLLALAGH
jgi:hypothetical protein